MQNKSSSTARTIGGILGALQKCFSRNKKTAPRKDLSMLTEKIRAAEPFRNLPDGNIARMIDHVELIDVSAGENIISEGQDGDYFYMVVDGTAVVRRAVAPGNRKVVAELKEGDGFGEDALISCAQRNATVCMKTDGVLLRLSKSDFNDYVKEPMIMWFTCAEAYRSVENGSKWLDVREDTGSSTSKLRGALCIPLSKLRQSISELNRNAFYICCCQNGRLSSTAAFILRQRGYKSAVLRGGLQGLARRGAVSLDPGEEPE